MSGTAELALLDLEMATGSGVATGSGDGVGAGAGGNNFGDTSDCEKIGVGGVTCIEFAAGSNTGADDGFGVGIDTTLCDGVGSGCDEIAVFDLVIATGSTAETGSGNGAC
ncbi:MAG: hypothetical protein IPJ25_07545 [Rhodocyclaceae bacterium]|nr:hypothetical protein [Rhodocyclaceae bacterium]